MASISSQLKFVDLHDPLTMTTIVMVVFSLVIIIFVIGFAWGQATK